MPIEIKRDTTAQYPWTAAKDNPGAWCSITETYYWELLNVLPPLYFPGGFAVSEPIRDSDQGTIYLCVVTKGDPDNPLRKPEYFCKATTIAEAAREVPILRAA